MLPTVPRSMQDITHHRVLWTWDLCVVNFSISLVHYFQYFITTVSSHLVYILHTHVGSMQVCLSTNSGKLCYVMNRLQKRHILSCAELYFLGYDCRTRISPLTVGGIVTFDEVTYS